MEPSLEILSDSRRCQSNCNDVDISVWVKSVLADFYYFSSRDSKIIGDFENETESSQNNVGAHAFDIQIDRRKSIDLGQML